MNTLPHSSPPDNDHLTAEALMLVTLKQIAKYNWSDKAQTIAQACLARLETMQQTTKDN